MFCRSRVHEQARQAQQKGRSQERRLMVGSQDRSEKIRTYNYPHNRVVDHRIHFTAHNLPEILDGALEKLIEALRLADRPPRPR